MRWATIPQRRLPARAGEQAPPRTRRYKRIHAESWGFRRCSGVVTVPAAITLRAVSTSPATPPPETLLSRERRITERGRVHSPPFGGPVRGKVVRWVVAQLAQGVYERASQEQRDASSAARDAVEELCRRLNEAVGDAAHHVSPRALRNPRRRYGFEYFQFILEHAQDISGDPHLLFATGAQCVPAGWASLLRPVPLPWLYRLAPRAWAQLVDNTRLELLEVSQHTARFRLRVNPQDPILNGPYGLACRENTCQLYQGSLAALPQRVAGRPWAQVTEVACAARGDAFCEWHLRWTPSPALIPVGLLAGLGLASTLLLVAGGGLRWGAGAGLLTVLGHTVDEVRRWRRNLRDHERARRLEVGELRRRYQQLEAAHEQLQVLTMDLEGLVRDRTTALAEANRRLNQLAITDELTMLYNRRHLLEVLHKEHDRARRYKHELCLVIFDVDHFKRFNDAYGHPKGDRVLRRIGHILQEGTRSHDTVARYGGEEFVVVLPQTQLAGALEAAEKLREAVESAGARPGEDPTLRTLSVSAGVAASQCGLLTVDALLQAADDALYLAKARGRNRVEVYPLESVERAVAR